MSTAWAQLPFFSGAEGYGGNFSGAPPAAGWFSNASVYHVTNLNDSGPGSLRAAFVQDSSNKIIVFDVAGTIQLASILDIKNLSNYYIAGQTAPAPVTVYGNTSQITASSNRTNRNLILRYLSFRKGLGAGEDSITFTNGGSAAPSTNMIVDHVSASWSEDEVLSMTNYNTNVTVQYSMMTDSLKKDGNEDHQYGSLLRPRTDASATFHHNLYGNDRSRNPRMGSYDDKTLTLDFVNNVIYNWSFRAGYAGGGSDTGSPTEKVNVNWVGNYAIAGPATAPGFDSTTAVTKDIGGNNPLEFLAYQSLNLVDSNHNATRDGVDTGWGMFRVSNGTALPDADKAPVPFATPPVTTTGAAGAYNQVMGHVGNWWWNRDAIDSRIIGNVNNNTQPAGGIPAAEPEPDELALITGATTPISHPPGYDTDGDAMPNDWEVEHGLNPNLASDWSLDFDSDGYINLIEYVNEAGEFPAPAPIVWNGATNNRYAQITNWKTDDGGITAGSNWQPSKYDEAQINGGTVVVDAVGQHAGLLKIAATPGSDAELQINSGSLEVEDTIVVGADPMGQGVLTLNGGQVAAQEVVVGFFGQVGGTGTLTGNVTNGGAVLPGSSPGTLTVDGDYSQTMDGVLSIDLASTSYDKLVVNGDVQYGGLLEVMLLDGYNPLEGATFDVVDWLGTKSGMFNLVSLPDLDGDLEWDLSQLDSQGVLTVVAAAPVLLGDYNANGIVDAADYTTWRDHLGTNFNLAGNGDETGASAGVVDLADYTAWKNNFGATLGSGSAAQLAPGESPGAKYGVPEPASWVALLLGCMIIAALRLRTSSQRSC